MVDYWSLGLDSSLDRVILSFPGAGQLTLAISLSTNWVKKCQVSVKPETMLEWGWEDL